MQSSVKLSEVDLDLRKLQKRCVKNGRKWGIYLPNI